MNSLEFEANIIAGMDDLRDQFPIVPALPMDDPLFAYGLGKAQDCNRLPARVLSDALKAELCGPQRTAENYGLPMHKTTVEDEDEPVKLPAELQTFIRTVAGEYSEIVWPSVQRSLTKTTAQPLAKRAGAFCGHSELGALDPNFDEGRKVLSVERRGKAKITKFEGGERWEIVED